MAIIPARGGSKGIPGKNLRDVGGRSLIRRAVDACTAARLVDAVVVSTDDDGIAAEAARGGATIVHRPADIAGDTASSESALVHALAEEDGARPDVVVFVQATSPFIDPVSIDRAVHRVRGGECDSVFAAVAAHEFLWRVDTGGNAVGVNHDSSVRLRRQDRDAQWRETGAFYVMRADGLLAGGHRFFGRVGIEEVDARHAIEIDTPADLETARAIAAGSTTAPGLAPPSFAMVELLVTDFDGVHTDDRATLSQDGVETVTVNRRDGHGVKLLRMAGIPVLILSTERNPVVARRAEKLGVECLHGLDDKWEALDRHLADRGIAPANVAYLGNDVNDLDCLYHVGAPIAVADADPRVLRAAVHVTSRTGGDGAVREVAELLIAARREPADPTHLEALARADQSSEGALP